MNYSKNKNILIEKHKCIFFVLPKNGCSSMKAQIIDVLELEKGANFPADVHNPNIYPYSFVKIEELSNYNSDYLIYCIVRNPWDRLVSCFKDKIRSIDFNEEGYINGVAIPLIENSSLFYGGMSFEAFVDVVCGIPDAIGEHHFNSQLYQVTDDLGNLLVNYIGRLETLKDDLKEISLKTGFPHSKFSHLHKTNRKSYHEYYTDELVEKVKNRYSSDIKFFKYEFNQNENLPKIGAVNNELRATLLNSNLIIPVLQDKVHSLQNTNINAQVQLKIQERKLREVKNSISWKITAPMRWLGKSK